MTKHYIELHKYIYALGINNVGISCSYSLARHYKDFDVMRCCIIKSLNKNSREYKDLSNIDGIGLVISNSLVDFFTNKKEADHLDQLSKHVYSYTREFN